MPEAIMIPMANPIKDTLVPSQKGLKRGDGEEVASGFSLKGLSALRIIWGSATFA